MTKKTGVQAAAAETAVVETTRDAFAITGMAVGRMSAVLAEVLSSLDKAEGKRLCRHLGAIVKAETEALAE